MQERRDRIVAFVNERGSVSFAQLRDAFPEVSEMTLRTDLKALDGERRLVRVHGGAKSVEVVVGTDDLLGRRAARSADAKERVAQKALALLRPDSTIYLDSGSTATALARLIPDMRLQLFTSSISCAAELYRLSQARVFMPGGFVNRYSQSLCGIRTVQAIRTLHFDLALLGTTSFSPADGFTCGVEEESHLKQAVLARADKTFVLMDSGKLGPPCTFTFAALRDVDGIVSDGGLPEEVRAACARAHVELL